MAFLNCGLFKLGLQFFTYLCGDDFSWPVLLVEILRDLGCYFTVDFRDGHAISIINFDELLQTQTEVFNITRCLDVVITRGLLFALKSLFVRSLITEQIDEVIMRLSESAQKVLCLNDFRLHQLIAKSCKYIADRYALSIQGL